MSIKKSTEEVLADQCWSCFKLVFVLFSKWKLLKSCSADTAPAEGSWMIAGRSVEAILCAYRSLLLVLRACTFLLWFRVKLQSCWPHYHSDHATCCSANVFNRKAVTSTNRAGRSLMSRQLTADLWRQIALRNRGCLSSGCHQLFVLSFSAASPHRAKRRQVPRITTHATHLHLCSQTHTLNCYLHLVLHLLQPSPPTLPDPPVMKTRCFYPPRTEGSSSAARLRAPTPLLAVDSLQILLRLS